VFVSGLGFSQFLFAWAAEDMKSRNWLGCHRRMFEYYGGVREYWQACQYCGNQKDFVMRRTRSDSSSYSKIRACDITAS
jgi:hypothetical protein